MRASESNTAPVAEEHEHTYPPQLNPSDSEPTSTKCSLRSILRIHRGFVARRRYKRGTRSSSPSSSRAPDEFGATTRSPSRTRSETSSDPEVRRSRKKQEKPAPKPDPPIIVPSFRYKVEPQTFVVRSELEFTTTCTVIQPVSRFQLKWPSMPSFRKFRIRFRLPRLPQKSQEGIAAKADKKRKRKSKGGVAIDQDVFDDALSLVPQHEPHLEEPDSQPAAPRRQSRQANQHKRNSVGAATKAARRNSGWAGVFSAAAIQNHHTDSNSSTDHTSTSHGEEGMSFEIDQRRNTLVVPDVDVGVAYTVKEEPEEFDEEELEALGLVFSSDTSDSEDSWLDLN